MSAHVVPIYPRWHPAQSRRRLASVNVPTPPQPVVRKSAFFSQDIKWMNLGYFALTGHQTIERAMESRTPTRPVPLALFSRYKQLAFSCRTTRKTAENLWPSPPDCRHQDGKSHFIPERSDFYWCRFETALSRMFGEWFQVEIKSRSFVLVQTGVNRCTNTEIK